MDLLLTTSVGNAENTVTGKKYEEITVVWLLSLPDDLLLPTNSDAFNEFNSLFSCTNESILSIEAVLL